MAIVAPSILSADFNKLGQELETIAASGCTWVHVDVMDGVFVPNISLGFPVIASIRKESNLIFDVHLMVTEPIRYVEQFCNIGADYLTIHLEADSPENTRQALLKIRALGKKAGISIKPGTPVEQLDPYLDLVDLILIMTVEPGFGGQSFMGDMMPKLEYLKEKLAACNPQCLLEVDGGIDPHTAPICKAAGATVLVSGSAFFKNPDKKAFVAELSK